MLKSIRDSDLYLEKEEKRLDTYIEKQKSLIRLNLNVFVDMRRDYIYKCYTSFKSTEELSQHFFEYNRQYADRDEYLSRPVTMYNIKNNDYVNKPLEILMDDDNLDSVSQCLDNLLTGIINKGESTQFIRLNGSTTIENVKELFLIGIEEVCKKEFHLLDLTVEDGREFGCDFKLTLKIKGLT